MMRNGMMGSGFTVWEVRVLGSLALVVLVLGAAALLKYFFYVGR